MGGIFGSCCHTQQGYALPSWALPHSIVTVEHHILVSQTWAEATSDDAHSSRRSSHFSSAHGHTFVVNNDHSHHNNHNHNDNYGNPNGNGNGTGNGGGGNGRSSMGHIRPGLDPDKEDSKLFVPPSIEVFASPRGEELNIVSEEGELPISLPPVLDSKKRSASHASLSVPLTPLSPPTLSTTTIANGAPSSRLSNGHNHGTNGSGHYHHEFSTATTVIGSNNGSSSSRGLSNSNTPLASPMTITGNSNSNITHNGMTHFGGSRKSVTRRKSTRWASQSTLTSSPAPAGAAATATLTTSTDMNTLDHFTRSPPVTGRNGSSVVRSPQASMHVLQTNGNNGNGATSSPPSSHRGNARSPMAAERGRLPSFASAPAIGHHGNGNNGTIGHGTITWASPRSGSRRNIGNVSQRDFVSPSTTATTTAIGGGGGGGSFIPMGVHVPSSSMVGVGVGVVSGTSGTPAGPATPLSPNNPSTNGWPSSSSSPPTAMVTGRSHLVLLSPARSAATLTASARHHRQRSKLGFFFEVFDATARAIDPVLYNGDQCTLFAHRSAAVTKLVPIIVDRCIEFDSGGARCDWDAMINQHPKALASHWTLLAEALLHSLRKVLGARFDGGVAGAWTIVITHWLMRIFHRLPPPHVIATTVIPMTTGDTPTSPPIHGTATGTGTGIVDNGLPMAPSRTLSPPIPRRVSSRVSSGNGAHHHAHAHAHNGHGNGNNGAMDDVARKYLSPRSSQRTSVAN